MMTNSTTSEFNPIDPANAANIEALPLLSTVLPYQFGSSTLEYVSAACACCGMALESDTIRGKFETKAKGATATLVAYGICYNCRTITPLEAKFHSDGSALFKGPTGWAEKRWTEIRPEGVKAMITGLVQRRWQQLLPPALVLGTMLVLYWNHQ